MCKTAIILAGGYGKRLLPLTENTPKPLLPLGSSTVLGTMADRLIEAGFTKLCLATMYKAEKVEAYPIKGARLSYFRETTPLGTAGCVKNASAGIKESFLVVSGDTVCDFDFGRIMEKHREGGYAFSIVCTRVSSPTEYGTVFCEGGRVCAMVEKPSHRRTLTDLVSTGIYVMEPSVRELIGDGEQDFAKNLIPRLLAEGVPVGCIEEEGYWCDIGDIESYYKAVFRHSKGKSSVRFGHTVVAEDAVCEGCILFDGVTVEGGGAVYDSIICENSFISKNAFIGGGCVIGGGSLIGEGAYVSGGTLINGGVRVEKGARIMKNAVFGEIRKKYMEDGVIRGRYGSFIGGALCLSLGNALSLTAGAGAAIGVMHGKDRESAALADSILSGIRLYGGRAYDLEDGFAALAAFAAVEYSLSFSVMVAVDGGKASLCIFDGDGLPPTHKEERAIEAALSRPVPSLVSAGELIRLEHDDRVRFRYAKRLTEAVGELSGIHLYIREKNDASEFLYAVLEKYGATVEYGTGGGRDNFFVSRDGFYAEAILADGTECSFWGLVSLGAALGGEVALPALTPNFVENAVIKAGGRAVFYGDGGREREAVYRNMWSYDANALVLRTLFAAKIIKKPLYEMFSAIPRGVLEEKSYPCKEESRAHTMDVLRSRGKVGRCGEGVVLTYPKGSVVVLPVGAYSFRLFAETVGTEAAAELFSKTEKAIRDAENNF